MPLFEDAALTGVLIAAIGLGIVQITDNRVYDGVASIGIGIVLIYVAIQLGAEFRALLIGEAVSPNDRERMREAMESPPRCRPRCAC
ncbi:MAG TPA: hypothetical protein VGR22_07720 [Thermomicrobiales bacterium]|nr:hypothetical protein [Thermomicrobiales bacterium]